MSVSRKGSTMSSEEEQELVDCKARLQGKRVIICEDEGVTIMQVHYALRKAGLVVAGVARDGQTGIDLILQEKPDLILMDITLEGMNGLEATRRIMQEQPTCIVMVSAYSDRETMEKARAHGAAGYLVKPIDSMTLLPRLCKALHQFYTCEP